jgi:hypothetical protein
MIRDLREDEVELSLYIAPETIPIEGNCSAIDPETDRQAAEWIRSQLEADNDWAWCMVTVEARWRGYVGRDHLGGCSYESEASFKDPDGYWPDMKAQALEDLNEQLRDMAGDLEELRA